MSTRDRVRELMALGKDTAEIAEEIGTQTQTVKYHINKIKEEDEVIKIKAMNSDELYESEDQIMVRDYLLRINQMLDFIGTEPDKAVCDAALTICSHILFDGVNAEFEI